jgi:uncharacterized protein (TIGR02145 family)
MKKQSKRFPLWGVKEVLSVALSGLGIVAFAQGAEVCQGTSYTITDAVPASAGSEYRWVENGNVLEKTNQATYEVLNDKVAGVYTYVRQSRSVECPDWQSSNEFTVTVFNCSFSAGTKTGATATFTDPRDGKKYKTVVMPDGRTWFAQNLNYTKDLTFNMYATQANGKQFTANDNGVLATGSYWCPNTNNGATLSDDLNTCNIYGAFYTWETAMMVDGKYADETKTSSAWDESWVSGNYYMSGAPGLIPNADKNNARGGTDVKGGGRGICPKGWHIPTEYEVAVLMDFVDGTGQNDDFKYTYNTNGYHGTDCCEKLRSTSSISEQNAHLGSWNTPGLDTFGFGLLGVGRRSGLYGIFAEPHVKGAFYSSSTRDSRYAWYPECATNMGNGLHRVVALRTEGQPVRCLSDK